MTKTLSSNKAFEAVILENRKKLNFILDILELSTL